MRYVDRPFAIAIGLFLLGSILGAFLVLLPPFRAPFITLLQIRLVTPVSMVRRFGHGALLLLVFLNNSIPAGLSFAYPFIIARVKWTPALTQEKSRRLLAGFTWLCAFLVGFFGLGVALSIGWVLGGESLLLTLLKSTWVHGPIEFAAVLLCVSEPLRLAEGRDEIDLVVRLRHDLQLLLICLLGLAVSAAIEVFANV
jgi:hypothetical protein